MNTKSTFQLLAPFGITVLLVVAFYLVALIIGGGGELMDNSFIRDIGRSFEVNIFDFDETNTYVFWMINVLLIIAVELLVASDDDN